MYRLTEAGLELSGNRWAPEYRGGIEKITFLSPSRAGMLLPGRAVKPSNMADKGSRYRSRLPIAQFDPPAMQNELALLVPMAITRWARWGTGI